MKSNKTAIELYDLLTKDALVSSFRVLKYSSAQARLAIGHEYMTLMRRVDAQTSHLTVDESKEIIRCVRTNFMNSLRALIANEISEVSRKLNGVQVALITGQPVDSAYHISLRDRLTLLFELSVSFS